MLMRHFVLATVLVILLAWIAIADVATAQEPTPTAAPTAQTTNDGFFSDIRLRDLLAFGSTGLVVILALWIVRVQSTRIQSARDELEDQRKRCADEIDGERRHSEQMRELSDKAEDLLQRRLDDAESRAGIDSTGQITADKTELPEDIRKNLSEAVTLLKEMKAARQHYEPTSLRSPKAVAREHLTQANASYIAREYEEALSEYDRALELRPDDPSTLYNKGTTLADLHRHEDALATFNRALELRPGHPSTLYNRGILLRKLGRQEEALADYDRSLELRPDHPDTLMNRGNVLGDLRRYQEALGDYNRSLTLRPDDPTALMNRGITLVNLQHRDEALADFNRSLELRPDDPDALMNRGSTLHQLGRDEDAFADHNRSLELRPDDPATLNNRGTVLDKLGRHDEALADYNRSLELRLDDPDTLNNRGTALGSLDRHEEALADYNHALELRPDDATTLNNAAIALDHLHRTGESLATYARAIDVEPQQVLYRLNRASLEAKLDNLSAAQADLDWALENGDLENFRRDAAVRAREHPYFEPLRANPSLLDSFNRILGSA